MQQNSSTYDIILHAQQLEIGYHESGKKLRLLGPKALDIYRGELICLIGPNGAGKSTLIRTLCGMQPPLSGNILIDGHPVKTNEIKRLSGLLSVVLTDKLNMGTFPVFNLVAIGRYPYTNWLGKLSLKDEEIIHRALDCVGMTAFAHHPFSSLSDGEKQRVMIARALAQDTPLIILDEPTAHLDLPNRVEIIMLLRALARSENKSILLSTHELDLALQSADRLWLMNGDNDLFTGTPEDLVLDGTFEKVFHKRSFDFDIASGTFKITYEKQKKIQIIGDSIRAFWTQRALERHGYKTSDDAEISVDVKKDIWLVQKNGQTLPCKSIWELLNVLVS